MHSKTIGQLVGMTTLGLAVAASSSADAAFKGAAGSVVTFSASGPAGLKIEGKTSQLTLTETGGQLHFVVGLASLDTGISLRNKHMREKYLEVAKYPNAELVIERSALAIPSDGKESAGTAQGSMTIHGQTKPVSVGYRAQRTGSSFKVAGQVHINMKDYGVDVPSYMGVTVKPDVDISTDAKVEDL